MAWRRRISRYSNPETFKGFRLQASFKMVSACFSLCVFHTEFLTGVWGRTVRYVGGELPRFVGASDGKVTYLVPNSDGVASDEHPWFRRSAAGAFVTPLFVALGTKLLHAICPYSSIMSTLGGGVPPRLGGL